MAVCEDHLSCIYALVWIGLIWFIIVPFEIYVTINMVKWRYHPGAEARYPTVVICSAIFAMIHSLICEQFYYLSYGVGIPILHDPPAPYVASIIFPPLLLIIVVTLMFRTFLIHYNINYVVAQSTRDWESLLCDEVIATDFYSRHHTTYGNCKYVSRYFIGYAVIATITDIGITICEHPAVLATPHSISQLVYMFWIFLMIVFGVIIYTKTPKFEDAYYVKKEIKYLLYLGGFCLLLYILMIVLYSEEYPIFGEIQTSVITVCNFGGVLISEYIMLNRIKKEDTAFHYGNWKLNISPRQFSLPLKKKLGKSLSFTTKSNGPSSRQLFNILIASPVSIGYFVKHLRSEFCIENLLCFIELIQWLYNVTDRQFDMFDIKPLPDISFDLSSAIPISSANKRNSEDEWDWKHSIILISQKYIHSSAEYQANFPYHIQIAFTNLINLLRIKQQTENGTYTFKNKPMITFKRKRPRFWEKKSSRNDLERSMLDVPGKINMPPLNEQKDIDLDEAPDLTIHFSYTPTKTKDRKKLQAQMVGFSCTVKEKEKISKPQNPDIPSVPSNTVPSYKRFINGFQRKRRGTQTQEKLVNTKVATLYPNASAPQTNDDKNKLKHFYDYKSDLKTHSFNSLHDVEAKLINGAVSNQSTVERGSSSSEDSIVHPTSANKEEKVEEEAHDGMFDLNANELVVLDGDYLYGDAYKDPEITELDANKMDQFFANSCVPQDVLNQKYPSTSSTQRSTARSTQRSTARSTQRSTARSTQRSTARSTNTSTMRSTIRTMGTGRSNIIITPAHIDTVCMQPQTAMANNTTRSSTDKLSSLNLKPQRLQLSVVNSFRKSLRKVNSLIRRTPKTPKMTPTESSVQERPNPEYLKEQKIVEQAKNLTVFEFVSVTCAALHVILQLNYQSVTRFKRSDEYMKMNAAVNLEQLKEKYGDKGVSVMRY